MSPPRILTVRSLILDIVKTWEKAYPEARKPQPPDSQPGTYGHHHALQVRSVWSELHKFDKTKATAAEVSFILNGNRKDGNGDRWVTLTCDACGAQCEAVVLVGDTAARDRENEGAADAACAGVCQTCVDDAARLLRETVIDPTGAGT